MSLRRSTPIAWRPRGLTDTLDSSRSMPGSMQNLQNLIPDPSTANLWQCRPGAVLLVDFNSTVSGPFSSGFSSGFQQAFFPGGGANAAISIACIRVFGSRAYGMVGGPSGFDYPFVFDLESGLIKIITGGTNTAKLPFTQPTTSDWVPPTIALVGTNVLITHPGFLGGGSNLFFGWFNISDPNNITWDAGNLTGGVIFTTPPSAVENFNGRAYWAVNPPTGQPSLVFSDVLLPRQITNSTQVLTFDDLVRITALAPLPLQNQVTGGIVQALMVFKGTQSIFQITGDAATNNLAKNALNVATGTLAPWSIAATTKGLAFISPEGARIIDFDAKISDPIGWDGSGKVMPFINTLNPSRICAAASGTVYRISVQDTSIVGQPFVEYWFDIVRGIWSGPHTCAMSCISNYQGKFVGALRGTVAQIYRSDTQQSSNSVFTENGVNLTWLYVTTMLPDTDQMSEFGMVETTLHMSMDVNVTYPVNVTDQTGAVLSSSSIFLAGTIPLWGSVTWGSFSWGTTASLFPRIIAWPAPIVFRRMALGITGVSSSRVRLGAWHCRYEQLGYLQQSLVA